MWRGLQLISNLTGLRTECSFVCVVFILQHSDDKNAAKKCLLTRSVNAVVLTALFCVTFLNNMYKFVAFLQML